MVLVVKNIRESGLQKSAVMAFGPEYSSSGSQSTGWEAQQNEGLLDGTNPAEGDCAMTKSISRRRLLAVLSGGVVGAAGLSAGKASAAASQHTLWRLNPDWGTPLTTPSGSATKTRCSGRACHLAAPHRFFLSQADALAGRLHSCCLAQPVPVTLCIDLNELMPFYRARLGGIDARCPDLPSGLSMALSGAGVCVTPPAEEDTPAVTPTSPAVSPTSPTAALEATTSNDVGDTSDTSPTLPRTGSSTTATVAIAAALVGAGVVASAAANRATE